MNSNWSYSPETKIWVVTSVTLTFDLWPWPFAWTLPWSNVITPENFMMIGWWEHSQKGVTDGQTDRRTDGQTDGRTDGRTDRRTENTIHRAAWSQLKNDNNNKNNDNNFPPHILFLSQNGCSYVYNMISLFLLHFFNHVLGISWRVIKLSRLGELMFSVCFRICICCNNFCLCQTVWAKH